MSTKILIVEDESSLSKALKDKFTKENFEVLLAEDGQKGLKVALEKHPDIILLDIVMPVMDGITMLEKLRLDDWGKNVPVIMLSNLSDETKVEDSVRLGSRHYMVKTDWHIDDVVKKVKEVLG